DGRGIAVDGGEARVAFNTWGNVVAPLLRRMEDRSWETLFAFAEGTASSAQRELATAMRLGRTIGPEAFARPPAGPPRAVWETSAPPARVRLLRWPGGASAFEVEHGRARWLLFAGRSAGAFDPATLPARGYDVVRLPEGMLEDRSVLGWLERERPAVLLASPWRGAGLAPGEAREARSRQEALGVYRPWRLGMARLSTDGAPLGRGAGMARFEMAAPWPGASPPRWVAWEAGAQPPRARSPEPEDSEESP
ncbi:MAG: hypothetical protein AABZ64_17725, partial [Nitrospinota bacterium]